MQGDDGKSQRSRAFSQYSMVNTNYQIKDLLKDKVYRLNLLIMVLCWIASSFCFFIIGFYIKYVPGDIFSNMIATSVSDGLSSIAAGVFAQILGTKRTITFSFMFASCGGLMLIFSEYEPTFCIMVTKFGINCAFTLCYIVNAEYFPAIVCSRVFGICNLFARFSTILSPVIAEIEPPIPMCICVCICLMSSFGSLFLTKNEEAEAAMNDIDDSISQNTLVDFGSFAFGGGVVLDGEQSDGDNFERITESLSKPLEVDNQDDFFVDGNHFQFNDND